MIVAINSKCPAFIDPPYWGDLQDWIDYREDLMRSDLPGVAPFVREADEYIARLTPP
jgi:hypothetical protein